MINTTPTFKVQSQSIAHLKIDILMNIELQISKLMAFIFDVDW